MNILQKLYHGPQIQAELKEWQFKKIPFLYEPG